MYRVRRDLFETEIEKYPQCHVKGWREEIEKRVIENYIYISCLYV